MRSQYAANPRNSTVAKMNELAESMRDEYDGLNVIRGILWTGAISVAVWALVVLVWMRAAP